MKLRRLGLALTVLGLMVAMLPLVAFGADGDVCPEGDGWVKVENEATGGEADGEWGEASGTPNDVEPGTVTFDIEDGFEVDFCLKGGSSNQGDGPQFFDDQTGEGSVSLSNGKGLSHWSYRVTELPDEEETTTTVEDETTTTTTTTTVPTTVATTTPTTLPTEVSGTSIVPQIPAVIVSQVPTTTAAPSTLPFTGIEDLGIGSVIGLVFAGLGTLLVVAARGRRQDEELFESEV